MTTTALASLLVGSGAISRDKLAEAQRRRTIYGGTLDTVLLEMGAVDERTITVHLAQATGLPAPLPERLANPDREARASMSTRDAHRLSAAPFGRATRGLELALHPDADPDAIAAWAEQAGLEATCFVVPEARFRELLAVIYGDVMPPRFAAVLGRMMGPDRARQRTAAAPAVVVRPLVETADLRRRRRPPAEPPTIVEPATIVEPIEPDIEIVEDAPAEPLEDLLAATLSPDPDRARHAIEALAERREKGAVPALIELLDSAGETAHAALVTITAQDFGLLPKGWLAWWQGAQHRSRTEWLFEALAHKRSERRLAAAEELQATTGAGVYFGYHFDLPERDREEARRRWSEWWKSGTRRAEGAR